MTDLTLSPFVYEPRWQAIMLLLNALNELRGKGSKRETLAYIQEKQWFNFKLEDHRPHPANKPTSKVPRWVTCMVWARKDCLELDLMENTGADDWRISHAGQNLATVVANGFRDGTFDLQRCFLWSPIFKHRISSAYVTGEVETPRPQNLYEDWRVKMQEPLAAPEL